jgi:redox-sensitive bicupin YhaK (pirin superfamily)
MVCNQKDAKAQKGIEASTEKLFHDEIKQEILKNPKHRIEQAKSFRGQRHEKKRNPQKVKNQNPILVLDINKKSFASLEIGQGAHVEALVKPVEGKLGIDYRVSEG